MKIQTYIFIFLTSAFFSQADASCSKEIMKKFSPERQKKIVSCVDAREQSGTFLLVNSGEMSVDLQFYDYGNENSHPAAEQVRIGTKVLSFFDESVVSEGSYKDINKDGRSEFVFRVSFAFGAMLMAVDVVKEDIFRFKYVKFFPTTDISGEPNNFLAQCASKICQPTVKKDGISFVSETIDLGVKTYLQSEFSVNSEGTIYLSSEKIKPK